MSYEAYKSSWIMSDVSETWVIIGICSTYNSKWGNSNGSFRHCGIKWFVEVWNDFPSCVKSSYVTPVGLLIILKGPSGSDFFFLWKMNSFEDSMPSKWS